MSESLSRFGEALEPTAKQSEDCSHIFQHDEPSKTSIPQNAKRRRQIICDDEDEDGI
jgi:hypothetical protein